MKKKVKNVILHLTTYEKIKFDIKDFVDFNIFDIRKSIYLNMLDGDSVEENYYTTSASFVLKACSNIEMVVNEEGCKRTPFDIIDNGCHIKYIEIIYQNESVEFIKIALFDDSPISEVNLHCESKILENGDLYVVLDKNINKDLSGFRCL